MSGGRDDAGGLVWEIPPSVDPRSMEGRRDSREDVRALANELEEVCGPERMSVQIVPAGVSRIHLRFEDHEAAERVFEAAEGTTGSHPDLACRVTAFVGA